MIAMSAEYFMKSRFQLPLSRTAFIKFQEHPIHRHRPVKLLNVFPKREQVRRLQIYAFFI